jgi:PAS domain S-box-containing protein
MDAPLVQVLAGERLDGEDLTPGSLAEAVAEALPEARVETVDDGEEFPSDLACLVDGRPLRADRRSMLSALDDDGIPVVSLVTADETVPATLLGSGVAATVAVDGETDPTAAIVEAVTDCLATGTSGPGADEEDRYRKLVRHIADPVYMIDDEGYVEMVNEALLEQGGYDKDDIVGAHVSTIMPDEDVLKGGEVIHDLLKDDEKTKDTFELAVVHDDGTHREYEDHVSIFRDEDGHFAGSVGIIRDIQDRKERERELEQYATIVETVPDGVFVLDEAGTLVSGNDRGAELIGMAKSDLIGRTVAELVEEDIFGTDIVERFDDVVPELLSEESDREEATLEFDLHPRDRDDRRICEARIALRSYEDDYRGLVGVFRDVTAERERQRELEQYETIVETVPDGVFILDEQANVVSANEAGASILGQTKEEAENTSIPKLISDGIVSEDVIPKYQEVVRDLLTSETDTEEARYEYTAWPHGDDDGRIIGVRTALRPYDEEFRGTVGVFSDITERKQRIKELERFETLVQAVPDALWATDERGYITFFNESGAEQFGYPTEELNSGEVHFAEVVDDDDMEKFVEANRRLLSSQYETGNRTVIELTAITKDGRRFPAEAHYALMPPSEEGVAGAGIARDISERKQRQERLQVLNRVLRHNLRNDLNVVLGNMELLVQRLEGEHDDHRGAEIAMSARKQGEQLVQMSKQVRQIQSALERERLDRPDIDAVDVVDRVVDTYQAAYPDATIERSVPDSAVVEANTALELMVQNLVDNAIQHHDGTPAVTVSIEESDIGVGEWYDIKVRDGGPGIPEQERRVLDEDADVTPLQHGSGLGLWTVSWIAQSFGGTVDITDNDPRGSVVTVRLRKAE